VWRKGKTYHGVDTYTTSAKEFEHPTLTGATWAARASSHSGPGKSYDDFRAGLFERHTEHEKE
jgi:hypothetical protein